MVCTKDTRAQIDIPTINKVHRLLAQRNRSLTAQGGKERDGERGCPCCGLCPPANIVNPPFFLSVPHPLSPPYLILNKVVLHTRSIRFIIEPIILSGGDLLCFRFYERLSLPPCWSSPPLPPPVVCWRLVISRVSILRQMPMVGSQSFNLSNTMLLPRLQGGLFSRPFPSSVSKHQEKTILLKKKVSFV